MSNAICFTDKATFYNCASVDVLKKLFIVSNGMNWIVQWNCIWIIDFRYVSNWLSIKIAFKIGLICRASRKLQYFCSIFHSLHTFSKNSSPLRLSCFLFLSRPAEAVLVIFPPFHSHSLSSKHSKLALRSRFSPLVFISFIRISAIIIANTSPICVCAHAFY